MDLFPTGPAAVYTYARPYQTDHYVPTYIYSLLRSTQPLRDSWSSSLLSFNACNGLSWGQMKVFEIWYSYSILVLSYFTANTALLMFGAFLPKETDRNRIHPIKSQEDSVLKKHHIRRYIHYKKWGLATAISVAKASISVANGCYRRN